jgi:ubiquinone/menaquinone biosynthesis C-methylase UbiE
MDSKQVKSAVREHYAGAARGGRACCSDAAALGYDERALGAVPDEQRASSLGCGSPVDAAKLRAGERVVDLGSGAGLDLALAARAVGPGGRVYGVDMTPEMIAKARAFLAQQGLANATVFEGEIEALPLPDASVDVVLSNCVINLSPDKARVFREAFRVLAPGGRFVVADMLATAKLPASVTEDPRAWSECIAGAIPEAEYVGALRGAGFGDVTVEPAAGCCEPKPAGQESSCGCECGGSGAEPQVKSATITARKPS